jgi:lia operon protein LiaI
MTELGLFRYFFTRRRYKFTERATFSSHFITCSQICHNYLSYWVTKTGDTESVCFDKGVYHACPIGEGTRLRPRTEGKTNRAPVLASFAFVYNKAMNNSTIGDGREAVMSEQSGKVLLGLVLLLVGALVLLDQFGIDSGDVLGILIPVVIMLYGAKKVMSGSGSRFWGMLVFLFGLLMLIGKLELLFHNLLAIGIIYLGYRLIKRRDIPAETAPSALERHWAKQVLREDMLDQWEQNVLKKRKL